MKIQAIKYLAAFSLLLFFSVAHQAAPESQPMALVVYKKGGVQLFRDAKQLSVNKDDLLMAADTLKTDKSAEISVQFSTGVICRIGQSSSVNIEKIARLAQTSQVELRIENGMLAVSVAGKKGDNKVRISAPTAMASVRGTDFIVQADTEQTKIQVEKGEVEVTDSKGVQKEIVQGGQEAIADKFKIQLSFLKKFPEQSERILKNLREQRNTSFDSFIKKKEEIFRKYNESEFKKTINDIPGNMNKSLKKSDPFGGLRKLLPNSNKPQPQPKEEPKTK